MSRRAFIACSLLVGAGLVRAAAGPTAGVTTLSVPGRANAHVSLVASDRFVAAVWAAATASGETDIYAAVSHDGAVSFHAPVRVNSTVGAARVNGEQPPRVTLVPGRGATPQIAIIWTAKTAAGTTLLTSRSTDGGRAFEPSLPIAGTDGAGNRGWEAIGADSKGGVHAVWLDHGRLAAGEGSHRHGASPAAHPPGAHGHAEPTASTGASAARPDGVAMAQQSDLYVDTLSDTAPPRAITAGVCYCCKTAMAFGPRGEMYLAWRHVYPGNFRDIAFTVSTDGGRAFAAPVRVSEDNWMLTGCPDDGPSMQVDRQGRIHIVWPAVVTERRGPVKALFHSMSSDGLNFSPRVRVPTEGQANHPQLAIGAGGELVLAWDESGDGNRRIVQARGTIDAAGRVRFTRMPGGEPGVYPAAAATRDGAVVAWTAGTPDASVIRVVRAPLMRAP